MNYDYCDCISVLCKCTVSGLVGEDIETIKTLASDLMDCSEDYNYLYSVVKTK